MLCAVQTLPSLDHPWVRDPYASSGREGKRDLLWKPASVTREGRAEWQTTEHVAFLWPLTQKPFPYLPLLWLTDGPEPPWPVATGALLCEWSITAEKAAQGSEQKQVNFDLMVQAIGCGIWAECVEALIRLRCDQWMTDKTGTTM